ncbi:MAG: NAD-dependent epimerase/dehydratase family protein [Phycisphaeraceae bacterium]|nr:NAD-dependent epimerase/dehydratase family protein [Phycisphaeraceae bacterium]
MGNASAYIVTGGAGFVGSNLVARLLQNEPGARVVVVDDFSSGSYANLVEMCRRHGQRVFSGEVLASGCDEIDWETLIEDTSPLAVFHLAAITDTTVADERRMIEQNSEAFRPILGACLQSATRLVYASSAATYGTPDEASERKAFPIEAAGCPNNVYGFSKWLMECDHRAWAETHREEVGQSPWVVGLRYFNVFGPGEARKGRMASMAYQLWAQIHAGGRPRLFRDGTQARDQVHVDDVVGCTLAAAGLGEKKRPVPGVYNVGSGTATAFGSVAEAVRRGCGLGVDEQPVEFFDMPENIRAFYQDYTCADLSATISGLGFTPSIDPIEGVEAYARWLCASSRRN